MSDVHVLAIDLAKRSFQVCGTDRGGAVLFNRTLSRAKLMQLLGAQPPCIVAYRPVPWTNLAPGFTDCSPRQVGYRSWRSLNIRARCTARSRYPTSWVMLSTWSLSEILGNAATS